MNANQKLKEKCKKFVALMDTGCFLNELQLTVYQINELSEEAIKLNKEELKPSTKKSSNNDFSKDEVKELKRRKKELLEHPERGTELKDL